MKINRKNLLNLDFTISERHDKRIIYMYYKEELNLGILVELIGDVVECTKVCYQISSNKACAFPIGYQDYDMLIEILNDYGHKKAAHILRGSKIDKLIS